MYMCDISNEGPTAVGFEPGGIFLALLQMTQVGVAQATEGPTRVLSTRQVDVEYLELSSATTCRGNQSMHAIRLLGLRHGL